MPRPISRGPLCDALHAQPSVARVGCKGYLHSSRSSYYYDDDDYYYYYYYYYYYCYYYDYNYNY